MNGMAPEGAGAGGGGGGAAEGGDSDGLVVINSAVDPKQTDCLNQKDDRTVAALFDENPATFLESDCDEQLLISMQFSQPVKIHSLRFQCTTEAEAPDASGPKEVVLFTNLTSALDFDDAEGRSGVQALTLTPAQVAGEPVELRFVKFQNVTQLTLFVKSNQGDSETTAIKSLEMLGQPRESTNMKDFKRVSGTVGERE